MPLTRLRAGAPFTLFKKRSGIRAYLSPDATFTPAPMIQVQGTWARVVGEGNSDKKVAARFWVGKPPKEHFSTAI